MSNNEDRIDDEVEAVTVLGPADAGFQTTLAPLQSTRFQSRPEDRLPVVTPLGTTGVGFRPTSAPGVGNPIKQEGSSRIPKPQLIVPDETRKQREEDAPSFFSSSGLPEHEPLVPQPIRLGNRRISSAEHQNTVRQPSRTSIGIQSLDQSQNERVIPERIQNQRPFTQNQRPSTFNNPQRRPPQRRPSLSDNEQTQFQDIQSPVQPQDQASASSQFQPQGQTFRTSPAVSERRPPFTFQQQPGSQFAGQPFRQTPRPTLSPENPFISNQGLPLIQSQGRPPFLNQEPQFQRPSQTQLFNHDQPSFLVPGRPQFQNQGQQQFLNRGQSHFQNHGEIHLQTQAQPQFQNNVPNQFSNQGRIPVRDDGRLPTQSDNRPPFLNTNIPALGSQGIFETRDEDQTSLIFTETPQPEEITPTEFPGFQTDDQEFQGHHSSDLPGSVSSVVQPQRATGLEEVITPEVQEAVHTLAAETPALPPPHPVCFELGLVPDPDRCYVFHECVFEEGQWQMYSWRCKRGQIFDPVNVACVRGRCARRGQTRRRRVRSPSK